MGDQACQTWLEALPKQPSSTVQGMEACVSDAWGIADVMQPSSSSQEFRVIADQAAKALSFRSDGLHVLPSTGESRRQALLR
jgi:hypothetical protein